MTIPEFKVDRERLDKGVPAFILFAESGLCKSRGEARRLIAQGGAYVNGERVLEFDQIIDSSYIQEKLDV